MQLQGRRLCQLLVMQGLCVMLMKHCTLDVWPPDVLHTTSQQRRYWYMSTCCINHCSIVHRRIQSGRLSTVLVLCLPLLLLPCDPAAEMHWHPHRLQVRGLSPSAAVTALAFGP